MAFGPETLQGAIIFTCKYLKLNKVEADPFFSQKLEHPSSQNVMQRRKS